MNRDMFWKLVQLLEERGAESGANTWHQGIGPGYEPRSIYQQIAAALHVLSDKGSSTERHRIHMDLGRGSVMNFVNRTITVLDSLFSSVVKWPIAEERRAARLKRKGNGELFYQTVGFLDGSEIVLREKPQNNHEYYFSRKKNYGFNLTVSMYAAQTIICLS